MSPDKQADLFRCYPDIFVEAKLSARESCMGRGIECGEGWGAIIDDLCAQLTILQRATRLSVVFNQVKSKFGLLRIYHCIAAYPEGSNDTETIHWYQMVLALIAQAETRSSQTCEETGDYGEMCVRGGWYKTLSEAKAKELGFTSVRELRHRRDEELRKAGRQETLS